MTSDDARVTRNVMYPSFQELVPGLLDSKIKADDQLREMQEDAAKIRAYYSPRRQFNRWKQSDDGVAWKVAQYTHQNGCCAMCNKAIECKGSHIDHIKPLSKFPELATDLKNLRIACADCNTAKGNKA